MIIQNTDTKILQTLSAKFNITKFYPITHSLNAQLDSIIKGLL